ncbi:MAG TPA: hypothetical protein LFW21_04805 [Rickettsia endosymbiont of Pyrocoelia pectoralis]|nr:hypothetical protein [Rickettsia endosymbiont of Pyrocoelia pectoralis]
MQKIIIQGVDTSIQSERLGNKLLDIPTFNGKEAIFKYLDEKHEANEIFINAHGGTIIKEEASSYLSKNENVNDRDGLLRSFDLSYSDSLEQLPSHLFLQLYKEENQGRSLLVNSILSKIINNTEDNIPNIVHIFSCFSGAAHNYLKSVEGNIVLCTYASQENVSRGMVAQATFQNYNTATNLIDFIVKNLLFLTGSSFAVTYKSGNAIYPLKFDIKDIENINNPTDITKFMQAQYKKITEFQHFDQNHSKIFPEYNLPEIREYNNEDLKLFWNQILTSGHINKLDIPQIQNLLKIDDLRIAPALLKIIEQQNTEILDLLLSYKYTKIFGFHFTAAVNSGNLKIIEMVFNKMDKPSNIDLGTAIDSNDPQIVKMVINKIDKTDSIRLKAAINSGNSEIVEMVVNKIDKIDSFDLKTAIATGNSQIIDIVRKKSDESNDDKSNSELKINDSTTEEKTSEIKNILDKNTDINILDFNTVINSNEINNSEKLNFLKKISNPNFIHFTLAQQCGKLNDIDKLDILKVILGNMTESCKLQLMKSCSNPEIIKLVESYIPHTDSEPTETIEHNNLVENHEVTTVGEVYDN